LHNLLRALQAEQVHVIGDKPSRLVREFSEGERAAIPQLLGDRKKVRNKAGAGKPGEG